MRLGNCILCQTTPNAKLWNWYSSTRCGSIHNYSTVYKRLHYGSFKFGLRFLPPFLLSAIIVLAFSAKHFQLTHREGALTQRLAILFLFYRRLSSFSRHHSLRRRILVRAVVTQQSSVPQVRRSGLAEDAVVKQHSGSLGSTLFSTDYLGVSSLEAY